MCGRGCGKGGFYKKNRLSSPQSVRCGGGISIDIPPAPTTGYANHA